MKPKPKKRAVLHSRGNPRARTTITGASRLNEKAVKVLAAIKFSPSSISREDIAEKSDLQNMDVERQVGLLLQLHLIQKNAKFPEFPQQGWRVYTAPEEHLKIITILKQHGFEDPRSVATRELLGDYYPTGMDLEGLGRQPNRGGANYPKGVPYIPELEFRPEAIVIMKKFRDEIKPFQPKEFSEDAVRQKKEKWIWFCKEIAKVYGVQEPVVTFGEFTQESWTTGGTSGDSHYRPSDNSLYFTGRFSLVTLLHELGHMRGFDERDAVIWSVNFGYRIFPVTFNRLLSNVKPGSHMLIRPDETQQRFEGL